MSGLVEVKILAMTMTSKYGNLSSGDVLRTDPAYAKHLVEDCHAAEYIKPVEVAPPVEKSDAESGKHKPQPKKAPQP